MFQDTRANLDATVAKFRNSALAKSTKRTYRTYLLAYVKFCTLMRIPLMPISPQNLGRFVAYLSCKLSFNSIANYLSIVRYIHLQAGYHNPLDTVYAQNIIKGAKRVLGVRTNSKLPITPLLLSKLHSVLDFTLSLDITFWAACLVAFFSFFRKSNLFAPSTRLFDQDRHLARNNISFSSSGALIKVSWSKTIQFNQRALQIPLPHIPNSKFCPCCILKLTLTLHTPQSPGPCSAFLFREGQRLKLLTYNLFLSKLKSSLRQVGVDPSAYSGHSFRRGGASFALECGLSPVMIKSQGDWASDAYQLYIDPSLSHRLQVASKLGEEFGKFTTSS